MTPQEAWDADRKAKQQGADISGMNVSLVTPEVLSPPYSQVLRAGGVGMYMVLTHLLHEREQSEESGAELNPLSMGEIAAVTGCDRLTAEKYILILEAYNVIQRTHIMKTNRKGVTWHEGYTYTLICPDDWRPADSTVSVGRDIPAARRLEVFERDGYRCKSCGARENLTIDHIIPVTRGGNSLEPNLQVLCKPCNEQKGVS